MSGTLIYRKKTKSGPARNALYRDKFHGKGGDDVSIVDQIIARKGVFVGLYDKEDLHNNVASNAERSGGIQLVLKPSLSRDFKRRLTVGDEITKALIQQASKSSEALLTGRTIKQQDDAVIQNGKKALSIALKYLDKKSELDPSGNKMEDYEKHILDEMYLLLEGKFDIKGAEESNNDNDDDEGIGDDDEARGGGASPGRPENWMFHGYFAFILCGPTADKDYKSDIWADKEVEPPLPGQGKKGDGRSAQRKAEMDEKKKECSAGVGISASPGRKCGASMETRTNLAFLAQQQNASYKREIERDFLLLNAELTDISNDIKERIALAQLTDLDEESRNDLASLQVRRTELRDELKLLRAKKPKVNPMAEELFASFASVPAMKQSTEVIPRPESVATLQGTNDTIKTTVTAVPSLQSLAAVQGHDSDPDNSSFHFDERTNLEM
jgi:hypothetical protein